MTTVYWEEREGVTTVCWVQRKGVESVGVDSSVLGRERDKVREERVL